MARPSYNSAKGKRKAKKDAARSEKLSSAIRHGLFKDERVAAGKAIKGCSCAECKALRAANPGVGEWG